jgi:hypothetical protein
MHKWFPQDAWIDVQPCATEVADQRRTADIKA